MLFRSGGIRGMRMVYVDLYFIKTPADRVLEQGCLAHAARAVDDDVLAGFRVATDLPFKGGPGAEALSLDDAAVLEWVHGRGFLSCERDSTTKPGGWQEKLRKVAQRISAQRNLARSSCRGMAGSWWKRTAQLRPRGAGGALAQEFGGVEGEEFGERHADGADDEGGCRLRDKPPDNRSFEHLELLAVSEDVEFAQSVAHFYSIHS